MGCIHKTISIFEWLACSVGGEYNGNDDDDDEEDDDDDKLMNNQNE